MITSAIIGGIGNTLLATQPTDPIPFISVRFVFSALILAWFIPSIFRLPKKLQLAAVLECLAIITFVAALSNISVALATTIGALSPVFALIINKLAGRQPLPVVAAIPIALGILSTILIASQNGWTSSSIIAILLALSSTILSTIAVILNGWYGATYSIWTRTAATNFAGALIAAPILAINYLNPDIPDPTPAMFLIAFIIALIPGILARALTMYALNTIPVPLVTAGGAIALLTATFSSWIFLGQTLQPIGYVGLICGIIATLTLAYVTNKIVNKEPLPTPHCKTGSILLP